MPVRKFRNLEAMGRSKWLEPGDPRIWDEVIRRWRLHQFFSRGHIARRPGVSKFRSLEEKQSSG